VIEITLHSDRDHAASLAKSFNVEGVGDVGENL